MAGSVLRTKQYLAAVRAKDGVLVLSTMLYADEVITTADLDISATDATKVSERELAMARQLVESLSGEFDPAKYHDTHREQVLELIENKAQGIEIPASAQPAATAPVIDLMAALEASLAATADADGDHKEKDEEGRLAQRASAGRGRN